MLSSNYFRHIPFLLAYFVLYSCSPKVGDGDPHSAEIRNVLWIISDDLANHAVGCYGNDLIKTPSIDALASEGVLFENAYANSPMCTPSRASFITGTYPHKTRTTLLRSKLPDETYTIAEHLKQHGYRTAIFGKTHFNSELSHGFDLLLNKEEYKSYLTENRVVPDTSLQRPVWKPFRDHARIWLNADGRSSGTPESESEGRFYSEQAIEFMLKDRDEPFLSVLSFREPHSPFNFPNECVGMYDHIDIDLPKMSNEDKRWIPEVFADLTDAEKKGITRSYYSSVTSMDANIGLVIEALKKSNVLHNTLIVVNGDHGYLLNHHGRFEKHMMWKESVKTPLIIAGLSQQGRRDHIVGLVDIVPTILDAIDLSPMNDVDGKSLLPIINSPDKLHKPYVFSEYYTDKKLMVTDGTWKYIYSQGDKDLGSDYETGFGPAGIMHRLYNLLDDPSESKDVSSIELNQAQLIKLKRELVGHFSDSVDAGELKEEGLDSLLFTYSIPPESVLD